MQFFREQFRILKRFPKIDFASCKLCVGGVIITPARHARHHPAVMGPGAKGEEEQHPAASPRPLNTLLSHACCHHSCQFRFRFISRGNSTALDTEALRGTTHAGRPALKSHRLPQTPMFPMVSLRVKMCHPRIQAKRYSLQNRGAHYQHAKRRLSTEDQLLAVKPHEVCRSEGRSP